MTGACPHCGADLRGAPIPQEYRDRGLYGTETHYSRIIGVEVAGIYDGTLYWRCPDCGGRWHRFPEGDPLRERAERYVAACVTCGGQGWTVEPDHDQNCRAQFGGPCDRTCPVPVQVRCPDC